MATDIPLGAAASLAAAAVVLIVGRIIVERIGFLRRYSIPEPVAGGLTAAFVMTVLHFAGITVAFDTTMQPSLMLAFFATIGLGADVRMLVRGGRTLLLFVVCVVGMLVVENVIGIASAKAMGIDPLLGLIAGSVTMAGGHGTGAAWATRFAENYGLAQAPALALASATFGLIAGGVIGGPVAMRLIRRLQAAGKPLGDANADASVHDEAEAAGDPQPEPADDLAAIDGIGPKEIGLQKLFDRATDGAVREVILATNFTAEGEATAHVIGEALRLRGLQVTRLARGVPAGSELEYVDLGTIAHAMVDRR